MPVYLPLGVTIIIFTPSLIEFMRLMNKKIICSTAVRVVEWFSDTALKTFAGIEDGRIKTIKKNMYFVLKCIILSSH